MADVIKGNLVINTKMSVEDAKRQLDDLQKQLNKLSIPENLSEKLSSNFTALGKELDTLQKKLNTSFKTKGDISSFSKTAQNIQNLYNNLANTIGKVRDLGSKVFTNIDMPEVNAAKEKVKALEEQINKVTASFFNIGEIRTKLDGVSGATDKLKEKVQQFYQAIESGDISNIEDALKVLETAQNRYQSRYNVDQSKSSLKPGEYAYVEVYNKAKAEVDSYKQSIQALEAALASARAEQENKYNKAIEQGAKNLKNAQSSVKDYGAAMQESNEDVKDTVENMLRVDEQIDSVARRIANFTSLTGSFEILRRTIRDAYNDIKELDAAMNSIAIVTDFTNQQLWNQVDAYAKLAQEMGVDLVGVYDVQKLYYQQGRDMADVAELTEKTLQFARIAEMDYADATDAMTVAINAFKLEATDASRVVDVYSNLAAKAAVDQGELANAMSKVASMASSVGMSLETTSAFLTQIIETTREAPETAGTALKTVLARFGEVKKLINTGENTGTTDEGETVDVNKIDTALKSVGIRLTDTQGQMRALDDVLLDLAKKWNSLDSMTQRYLATMAAGSRQQSRFIALMANSERLTKLLGEAYNSAGAGEKQYEKTLDSLESKLNNLHTAWTQFTTSLVNSEFVKTGIELLTKLLNIVNALTDAFGPLSGTIKIAATSIGLWKVNTSLLPKVTNSIKNILHEIRSADDGTDVGATAKKMAAETEKGTKLGTIFAKAYAAAKNSVENAYQKEQEAKDILNAQILGTEKAKAEMTSKKMYELAATTQGIEDAKLQATAEGLIYGEWKAKSQEEAMEAFESLSSVKRITTAFAYGKATGESWGAGFSSALAAFKTTDLFTKILSPFGPVIVAAMASAVVASIPAILNNADSIISNYKIKKNNQAKAENDELLNQYEAEITSLENQESLSVGDKRRLQYLKEQTEELKKQNELLNQQNFGEEKKKRGKKEYTVYEQVEYTQAGGNERSSNAGETKTKTVSKQLEGEDAALDYASQKIDEYQEKLDNLGKGDSRYEGYKGTIEYYKNIAQDIFDFYSDSFEEITDTSDYEKLFKAADILGKDASVLELFDSDTYDKIKELNEQGALSAENLADLAKKSDILRIYLDTTGKTVEDFVKDLKSLETTNPFSADKITGYKNAAEEIKNIKTSVSAITDAVSNLYKDGYVDIEKLSTIVNDDAFNKLPSFEKFFDILSKAGKEDIPQVTTAMETLLQEYMSSETVLTSLNETTAGLYENMLKNMGVTNASEVIENKLQQRRAETAAQTLTLAEINNLLSGSNNNLSSTLANLANQYNTTTQYIAAYLIKMKIASGAKVSTAASRAELEKLVKSLGIASDALSAYYNIIAIADSQQRKATLIRTGAMAGTEAEARQYMLNANANYESAKKVLAKKADEILNTTSNITIDTSSFNTAPSKSSSSSKAEKEIQKLSELYNAKKKLAAIDEKINDLEEKDNILQDYDSMLANERELIAAQKEKQDILRDLINQNEALRKQKLAEATSAWKNFYNVDETTHELQLTKTYYEAIKKGSKTAAKYSADTLNNFKKWAEEYEDIVEFSREQENSIDSINSKLLETWYNYRSDYVDLVNQLAELYEQAQQKIIDDQKDAYDKLKEQDDNYLDELRKNIDARRKARDRENDVEEIVKKQKRLAMLMRDSSGRNAGDIADLQKEIQDAQQDVIDDDIDKVIDSMEEANDKQQENWDNVIDKLQEQLDQDKENGKFIRLAEQKFEEGPEAVMEQFRVFFQTTGPYSQAEIDKKLKEVLDKLDNAFEYYNGNNPAENPGGTGNRNYTPIKYLDPNGNVQQGYISSEGKTYKDRGLTERVDEGSIVPDAAGKHAWKLVGDKGVDVTSQLTDAQKRILGIDTGGQGTSSSNTNTNTTTSRAKVANTGGRGVNLRSGPGQNYRKVGAYSDGTTVTVLDESNSAWWKVKVGNATGYMASQYLKKYLNGGLVDFTGPAWVDGSKSAPEAFLDAQDTRNFAQLKDILASLLRADRFKANEVTTARGGDCTIYVTVDQIASDYDVDEAVARIKQEIMSGSAYRNINLVNRHR